ncbi:nicotinate phosphoribosyltransferase [Vibrio quintilis]|uniref:Nicotinate phosphoribosyltransferase n=1 Tax=Vibrio quintilis TaxID=1117707 RepID=A0A1M7Z007_9VIBR|nr:nicotinate phosphoribosyltransferase [Vibrio quintilis]SHO58153.1 Nicotinate phosphoribosyltransferase [Vibrio quintilis]
MNTSLFSQHMIKSLLDLDAYKINMMQAIHSFYPDTAVRYELIVRSDEDISDLLSDIRHEIKQLAQLQFSEQDIQYLKKSSPHLKTTFLHSLRYFRFQPEQQVELGIIHENNKKQLRVSIYGTWRDTILYETIIMSIISEVRSRRHWADVPADRAKQVLLKKITHLKNKLTERGIHNFKITEMGTRRRFSSEVQHQVIECMQQYIPGLLLGTSNYHYAREFNLQPIGTIAHEWFMGHQALVNPADSQQVALEQWLKAFDGQLSIAPTDTLTIDAFINDFNVHLAKAYDGVRHDSGCPYTWGDKMIAHYERLGIDPKTKLFVFSDGLNFDQALDICEYFSDRVQISFGIGTFLTNDLDAWTNAQNQAYQPLSIVIKLAECNSRPVAKISDKPEKAMCEDIIYLAHLKQQFNIPLDIDKLISTLKEMKNHQRKYIAAA